jgi:hypothetical protein
MQRKRTVSERITENGDPLVVRKKACDAAKQGASASVASKPSTASSTKRSQVWLIFFWKNVTPYSKLSGYLCSGFVVHKDCGPNC